VTLVIAVVAVVVALASYLTLLASRLDRLAIRVEAAEAALDAQLARRAIAAYDLSADAGHAALHRAARAALDGDEPSDRLEARGERESALSRALREAPELSAVPEMAVAARKVMLARQFYNDAVRDLLALRRQPIVRVLHLYGRAKAPAYAEFDADEPGG
jgi:hypothetical protein